MNEFDSFSGDDVVSYDLDALDRVALPSVARSSPQPRPRATRLADHEALKELEARARSNVRRHLEKRKRRRKEALDDGAEAGHGIETSCYCIIDLETTGAHPEHPDEILELGMIQMRGFDIGSEFSSLVNPGRPISPAAHAVHRIRAESVQDAPRIGELLPYLGSWSEGRVLVFHNAGFDLGFLQRALLENERQPLGNPVLDTLVLARRLLGGACGLGRAAWRLGLAGEHRHRALPDAKLTALLLRRLLQWMQQEGAKWLHEVPGFQARPTRRQRRRHLPQNVLLARLRQAQARGEALTIVHRETGSGLRTTSRIGEIRCDDGVLLRGREGSSGRSVAIEVSRIDVVLK